jgi:hypothetical protein
VSRAARVQQVFLRTLPFFLYHSPRSPFIATAFSEQAGTRFCQSLSIELENFALSRKIVSGTILIF